MILTQPNKNKLKCAAKCLCKHPFSLRDHLRHALFNKWATLSRIFADGITYKKNLCLLKAANLWQYSTVCVSLDLGFIPDTQDHFPSFLTATVLQKGKPVGFLSSKTPQGQWGGVRALKRTSSDRNCESETIHQRDPHSGKLAGKVKDELP